METPRNSRSKQQRAQLSATPKIGARRKSLFKEEILQEFSEESLDGIDILPEDGAPKASTKSKSVARLLRKNTKVISFLSESEPNIVGGVNEMFDKLDSVDSKATPRRRSPRNRLNNNNNNVTPRGATVLSASPKCGKENMLTTPKNPKCDTDELQNLFSNSMSLRAGGKKAKGPTQKDDDSSDENTAKKRPQDATAETSQAKIRKLDFDGVANGEATIPTRSFYSANRTLPQKKSPTYLSFPKKTPKTPKVPAKRIQHQQKSASKGINRGVQHGIRRPKKPVKRVPQKADKERVTVAEYIKMIQDKSAAKYKPMRIVTTEVIEEQPEPVEELDIIESSDAESVDELDFSFSDDMDDMDAVVVEAPVSPPSNPGNRKFFKSGRTTTKKEVQITGNIKASMAGGKLKLVGEEKKEKKVAKRISNRRLSQAVDNIIRTLDTSDAEEPVPSAPLNQIDPLYSPESVANYNKFRNRLPYNTTDPFQIEQQHLLLDFLITNEICTEKNFQIFIADPENHKEEAYELVQRIEIQASDEAFKARLPYKTTDPEKIKLQRTLLDFLIDNGICTEENFEIFIADYDNRREEADRIVNSLVNVEVQPAPSEEVLMEVDTGGNKLFPIFYPGRCKPIETQKSTRRVQKGFNGGYGANQLQIDAGQKSFGAKQCRQCGLLYTAHEPEEERLHNEYHNSLHILRFKGWIDEEVVVSYPEWGVDGRIIRVTNNGPFRRRERVQEVLKVVDAELGFSSYILPKEFVCFLAVAKSQIIGLCLVQALKTANKYIALDGVDCCTEEEFEARCGISRIWVAPLHRRFHVGLKLLKAVQSFSYMGEHIPMDKIAFSAPTEDGKAFAQKASNTDSFLVYQ